jgi:hypothetical protein
VQRRRLLWRQFSWRRRRKHKRGRLNQRIEHLHDARLPAACLGKLGMVSFSRGRATFGLRSSERALGPFDLVVGLVRIA